MRFSLTLLTVAIGFVTFAGVAQAAEGPLGRGGWDGNDAHVSVVKHGLLAPAASETHAYPGGGWDANDARVSVVKSNLLKPATTEAARPGGGWDLNDARVSVVRPSHLLTK